MTLEVCVYDATDRVQSILQVHNMHVEYNRLQKAKRWIVGGPSLQKDNDTEE